MHCLYVGVVSVINEANMFNDIVQQPTSELNGRTTDNDSWLHRNNSFQRIPLKDTTYIRVHLRAYDISC